MYAEEISQIIDEVCYIYNKRNELNKVRSSLRFKLYYWRANKRHDKNVSKSSYKLRLLRLRGELLLAKVQIMEHTKRVSARLKELKKLTSNNFKVYYDANGYVNTITFNNGASTVKIKRKPKLDESSMFDRSERFAINKAVNDFLTQGGTDVL